ncbi:uncharacterized protein LOC111278020 [Durio zibethinus]|uniref:Uncharacterized protein LOC111278020 n=1 Tax=Durio zibethinus TaxID=66656 RepID=A0A6P5WX35_DURZI|nr:uncharacterized protein LOC111278020 [Durio zibethinus]
MDGNRTCLAKRCSPPREHEAKVNVEAAVDLRARSAGLGAVVGNGWGQVLLSSITKVSHVHNTLHAEMMAKILFRIVLVRQRGFESVIVERDASLAVEENTDRNKQETVMNMFGIQVTNSPEKYLGLPMMFGREKRKTLRGIANNMRQRVQSWSQTLISDEEREVFVKAILQSMARYALSCFMLPRSLHKELNMSRYWGRSGGNGNGIHWLSWRKLCKGEWEGGMGFREMNSFNEALLAKQGWRLLHNSSFLVYRVLKEKHFPTCSFLEAKEGRTSSYLWKSICAGREVLRLGARWRVGNGEDINVWSDPWILKEDGFIPTPRDDVEVSDIKVKDLIAESPSQWDITTTLFPCNIIKEISLRSGFRVLLSADQQSNGAENQSNEQTRDSVRELPIWRRYEELTSQTRSEFLPGGLEVWKEAGMGNDWMGQHWHNIIQWLGMATKSNEGNTMERLFTLAWAIWSTRNNAVKNQIQRSYQATASFASNYLKEYQRTKIRRGEAVVKEQMRWKVPIEDTIKINFDGALDTMEGN